MKAAVSIACEGFLDRVVLEKLLADHGIAVGPVYDKGGKAQLDRKLPGYTNAARFGPWIIHRDLNGDAACAPELATRLIPHPPAGLCFIVSVRQTEAWLLADGKAIASYLDVSAERLPDNPESLTDPKGTLIDLVRHSQSPAIRRDMVPVPGSRRAVGVGYTARMQAFILSGWSANRASRRSASLATLMRRLRTFRDKGVWRIRSGGAA